MNDLSPINRPVTLGELSMAFDVPLGRLRKIAAIQAINPACRIGRTWVYGPDQIRRLYAAAVGTGVAAAS